MRSSPSKKYNYSASEARVLDIINKGGRVTTSSIVEKVYGKQVPINGRTIIGCVVRSLIEKTKLNKEKFRVNKSKRRGPHPIEVWIDKKGTK